MKTFLILFIVCAMSTVLFAQAGVNPDHMLEIPLYVTLEEPTVDGIANEAIWDLAVLDTCRAYGNAQDSIDAHRSVGDCELNFKVICGNGKMYLFLSATDDSVEAAPYPEEWWLGDGFQIKIDPDANSATGHPEIKTYVGDVSPHVPITEQANFVKFVWIKTANGFDMEISADLDSLEFNEAIVDSQFYFNIQWNDYEGGFRQTRFKYSSYHQGWNHVSNFINTAKFVAGTGTSVEVAPDKPSGYNLLSNYPNPFNPQTTIQYAVNKPSHVTMVIFNQQGQQIEKLVNGYKQAGNYSIIWNVMDQPSGIYYCRIIMDNYNQQTRKMLLLK